MTDYKVWIKQHGPSAKNAGTIYGKAEPRPASAGGEKLHAALPGKKFEKVLDI